MRSRDEGRRRNATGTARQGHSADDSPPEVLGNNNTAADWRTFMPAAEEFGTETYRAAVAVCAFLLGALTGHKNGHGMGRLKGTVVSARTATDGVQFWCVPPAAPPEPDDHLPLSSCSLAALGFMLEIRVVERKCALPPVVKTNSAPQSAHLDDRS